MLDARLFRDEGLKPVLDPTNQADIARFLGQSFDPRRTMLGAVQVRDLERDLLAAQKGGVTWKFVFVPEPIQNLGIVAASDRFEGYAAERTRLLSFIDKNKISNVVFVAADLHGTLVNNLFYQTSPIGKQIPVPAFEVITGAIAYDAPLGPTVVEQAEQLGVITKQQAAFYRSLPRVKQDEFIENLTNAQIVPLGYDPLGLQNSNIKATLQVGGYTNVHTYGWTEFDIDRKTGRLTVTTYGIEPYTQEDLKQPKNVLGRKPAVISRFVVDKQ